MSGFGEFMKNAALGNIVKQSKDASGYVNGIQSADGPPIKLLPANSFCVVGDSRAAKFHQTYTVASGAANILNGIMAISMTGHVRIPGERINIQLVSTVAGASRSSVNGSYTVLDVIDANNFRINLGMPELSGAVLGSGSGSSFQYTSVRETNAEGHIGWAMALSDDRMEFVDTFAIGGATLDANLPSGVLNQIDRAIATGCRNIVMDIGINTINARVDSEDTMWANMKVAYAKCLAANVTLYDCSTVHISPTGTVSSYAIYSNAETGYTNFGHKTNVYCAALNERRRRFARQNPGIKYVAYAEATIDASSATGSALTAYMVDGLHFNVTGARRAGQVLANMWKQDFPAIRRLPYSQVEAANAQGTLLRNVSYNPLFNNGAPTNGLAAGWNESKFNTTSVTTIAARTDAADGDSLGNNQLVAITASAAGSYTLRSNGSNIYSVTDILKSIADIKLTSMTNVTYLVISANQTVKNSLGADVSYVAQIFTVGNTFDNSDLAIKVGTMPMNFPPSFSNATTPNATINISVGFGAGGGSANLSVGCSLLGKQPNL